MALTKEISQDKIEIIGEFKSIHVRTATIIKEDGTEISRSFHRHVIMPGEDYSGESAEVRAICGAVHTDSVITAYESHIESMME